MTLAVILLMTQQKFCVMPQNEDTRSEDQVLELPSISYMLLIVRSVLSKE